MKTYFKVRFKFHLEHQNSLGLKLHLEHKAEFACALLIFFFLELLHVSSIHPTAQDLIHTQNSFRLL